MEMHDHAVEELKYLRTNNEPDEMQDLIEKDILEIVDTFAKQGHSGFTAHYCIPIINKLLLQENITPLTGEDREWSEVSSGVFQNKRRSSVFKQVDRFNGQAYELNGKIFSDDGGKTWFTNGNSLVPIKFPYIGRKPEKILIMKDGTEVRPEAINGS